MAFVLIGFMGAGKSTAALELAGALGAGAKDTDAMLAERFGHSLAQEFEQRGEAAFRAQEEELVLELLARAGDHDVLALGGGSVLSPRVQEALASHVTVLLDVDPAVAWERVRGDGERPLAGEREAFVTLHEQRRALYESLADVVFEGCAPGSYARAARALSALAREAPPGVKMLWASASSGEYPVYIGRGLLPALDALWPFDRARSRAFCVTDRTVGALYAAELDVDEMFAIEPGEEHKTLADAQLVWSALVEAGATRADHVVALGGGVVGDLAGFCAATYQRGIPVVQVPTTLVAQVDSAYGGKTGVDLPMAKNYVGAYHQPAAVFTDLDTLATLPAEELAAGWVEVLKTGLIAGGELWQTVAAGQDADERAIVRCVRTKLATVAADERDGGRRQALNLGHTVGHGIEAASGYARYRHGEAVGLGLLAALRLSGQPQLRALVAELLAARGLPRTLDEAVELEDVMKAVHADKKRLAGEQVPFVLVREPGAVEHGCKVGEGEVRAAVRELYA